MIEFRKVVVFLCVLALLFYMIRLLLFTKRKWPLKSYTFGILISGITFITIACFLDVIVNVYDYQFIRSIIKIGFTLGAVIYIIGTILWSKFTKVMMDTLEECALTDSMTGVLNRNGIEKIYESLVKVKKTFYVIVCDLNGMKVINDTYGHMEGDSYIYKTTKIIRQVVESKGYVSRIGGDEFVILLEETNIEKVEEIKLNIKQLVSEINLEKDTGISIGHSIFPKDGHELWKLIKSADEKMYEDKKSAKVCV